MINQNISILCITPTGDVASDDRLTDVIKQIDLAELALLFKQTVLNK